MVMKTGKQATLDFFCKSSKVSKDSIKSAVKTSKTGTSLQKIDAANMTSTPIAVSTSGSKVEVSDGNEKENMAGKEKFVNVSAEFNEEQKKILATELKYISPQWLNIVKDELKKPYFIQLKQFLASQRQKNVTIFPLENNIYSFTNYCPEISKIKVLILGQDPYHNFNQAHGLAFSVLCQKLPPSLQNIYKGVKMDYPEFVIPKKNGNLEPWARQGVLLLNTCLTVEAHKANSHNNKGWEKFTSSMIKGIINHKNARGEEIMVLAWGSFAINMIRKTINLDALNKKNGMNNRLLTSVHPSPLSASRGFFTSQHFKKCNQWISEKYGEAEQIDWTCIKDVS